MICIKQRLKIGKDANAFEAEKMIILFGDNAPDELVDFVTLLILIKLKMRLLNQTN